MKMPWSYWRDWMTKIKPGDAAVFRRLFNFLIKCQSLQYSNNQNLLDTSDMICIIASKVPVFQQDRWNRYVQKIRKNQTREPGLLHLINFIEDKMALVNDPLFSRELSDNMKVNNWSLTNQRNCRVMLSRRHQETRIEKLQSAKYVKVNRILRSAQQFWNKLLRIKVRPFTRNVFVMVV